MKKILITIIILFMCSSEAIAEDASIGGFSFSSSGPLKLSFVVEHSFTEGIEEAINSGMPTIFTFKVKMYGVKRFWPDDKIGTWRFNHTVKYDSLLEEYTVTLQESGEIIKTKDFNEMKKLMSTVSDMNISPMPKLVAGKSYRIKVKAELDPVKLPFHLDYLMFFVKLWDFETEWFDHGFERN